MMCICLFFLHVFNAKFVVDAWIFYLLFAALFLIFSSANSSSKEFGQPFWYGVLAQRQYFIVFGVIVLYTEGVFGRINSENKIKIIGSMIILCFWFNLIFNFLMQTVARSLFSQVEALYVIEEDRLRLPTAFVLLGVFYYAEMAKRSVEKATYYYFVLFGVIYFLVFDGGRSNLICVAIVLLISSLLDKPGVAAKIYTIFKVGAVGALVVSGFFFFSGDLGEKLANKYAEAFYVVMTGQEGLDDSANSRIQQAEVILEGVERSPLLGSGFLSAQFNEGFKTFFGYFHPSDNGFGGIVYVWGYIGLVVILLQLVPMFTCFGSVSWCAESASLWLMTLYHLLFSTVSGKLAFGFEFSVTIISMMMIIKSSGKRNE